MAAIAACLHFDRIGDALDRCWRGLRRIGRVHVSAVAEVRLLVVAPCQHAAVARHGGVRGGARRDRDDVLQQRDLGWRQRFVRHLSQPEAASAVVAPAEDASVLGHREALPAADDVRDVVEAGHRYGRGDARKLRRLPAEDLRQCAPASHAPVREHGQHDVAAGRDLDDIAQAGHGGRRMPVRPGGVFHHHPQLAFIAAPPRPDSAIVEQGVRGILVGHDLHGLRGQIHPGGGQEAVDGGRAAGLSGAVLPEGHDRPVGEPHQHVKRGGDLRHRRRRLRGERGRGDEGE